MADYATQEEFAEYVEGWTTTDPEALERLLVRAERDVDSAVGAWTMQDNGLKFGSPKTTNEQALTASQVAALSRATCAQAYYRQLKGDEFFIEAQHDFISGPDFSTRGTLPRVSPQAVAELDAAGLRRVVAAVSIPVVGLGGSYAG